MPQFTVTVTRTITQTATVEGIEASDDMAAMDIVQSEAEKAIGGEKSNLIFDWELDDDRVEVEEAFEE